MPKISVVVPVYKVEKWLEICIDSILKQTFSDFELLLVDDGSPDDSGALCERYADKDERVRVFHKQNGGLSDARNYGTERARGEYVTYIDSDDYVESYYLEVLYHAIEETGADVAVALHDKVEEEKCGEFFIPKPENIPIEIWCPEQACAEMARGRKNSVISCCKLGKIQFYRDAPFEVGVLHEDLRHTYRILQKSPKIAGVQAKVYHYVMHGGSITTRKVVSEKQCRDYYEAIHLCTDGLYEKYPNIQIDIDTLKAREYMSLYLMSGRVPDDTVFIKQIRKEIVEWFSHRGMVPVFNKNALLNVRLRSLLMAISPTLYRCIYYIGIRFTGKKIG